MPRDRLYIKPSADTKHLPQPKSLEEVAEAIGCPAWELKRVYEQALGYPKPPEHIDKLENVLLELPFEDQIVVTRMAIDMANALKARLPIDPKIDKKKAPSSDDG